MYRYTSDPSLLPDKRTHLNHKQGGHVSSFASLRRTAAATVMPWPSTATEGSGSLNYRALAELRDPSRTHELRKGIKESLQLEQKID
ncbi:hypothetical protein TNIN_386301 [Trichonephila inaurata madagascariensis]|uniref:Uncharacterized protein n=1 Tax=Trichonephila inaurata madagascariensis TaxID=2747483 RepID=A0A8X6X9K6_9ARAC|nr:hypothetical protein TNIN_386301 [Trichonephila inaurata madagascariensis]